MGKGDRKSRKGKIFRGSHGVKRPKKAKTEGTVEVIKPAKAAPKKAAAPKEVKPEKPKLKKKTAKE